MFSCVDETHELPSGKIALVSTNDKEKEVDSKILKSVGMNRLKLFLENDSLISHQTLAKLCKIVSLKPVELAMF